MKIALRVSGNTYQKKDELKKLGCRWLAPLEEWVWFGEDDRMLEMASKIKELGLDPWLNVEDSTGKLATFSFQEIIYASCSNQPKESSEYKLGTKFYDAGF